jgi:hypothetical protein
VVRKRSLSRTMEEGRESREDREGESLGERDLPRSEPSHENDRFEKSKSQMNKRIFNHTPWIRGRTYALCMYQWDRD